MQNRLLLMSIIVLALTCSPIAFADEIIVTGAGAIWNLTLDDATDVNKLVGEPGVMVARYADATAYKPLENATEVDRLVGEPDVMVVKYADAFTYQPLENATSVGRLVGEPGVMVVKYADASSYQPLENATDVGRLTGEPDMIVVKYADTVWEFGLAKGGYLPNQTHDVPYIELTALASIKTVNNINASYSIGIFNGQNNESTFDLTVLNHNLSSVATLNQSTICIPPWESREVTLNVTDETPGEYIVSVCATSRNNSDVTGEVTTRTIVQESFNINMTSLEGTKTSIGANITYLLTIQNNQKNKDTLTLNSSGIDPSWISFDTVHQLGSGEQKTIPIKISIPGTASAGNFTLIVSATSSNVGTIRNASLPLVVQNGPIISGLVPLNNSYLGSDDVIFTWTTNINSTTNVILNHSGIETAYTNDEGIYHSVVVENLTRNQWYTYKVISNTSYGSTESEERSFYIDNGVTFTERIYDFDIERDYDQRVTVTVRNTDSTAHEILLNVNSTNPELIAGFIGEGSIDEMIALAPDETKDITLALHAQDAAQRDYYLSLNLTTDDNIADNAIANIHVRLPNIDLRFEELSIDPLTLTKTIRLTNHGDTVTDLNIYGNGGLKGNVTFQPTITHGYLRSGRSIIFEAIPVLSLDFTGMNGSIVAEAVGVKTNLSVNYTLPEGMNVYFGTVPNVTVEFSDYFDNDDSPNTNPQEGMLVESYLTNGSLVFFSQIIVDVYQDGEPVSNASVTLKTWDSNGKTLILNGVSDFYGKALFAVFGKADNYSYKAMVDNYNVETETRNFSVDRLNPLYHVYTNNITWLDISDSNSTFTNFSESIVFDNAPYFFKATKNVIEDDETFILDLRWKLDHQKQVTIPGSTEGNNITFNTSGIPVGNYTATIVSLVNKSVSLSETINITVTDVNGMNKQKNFSFWVPFPINKTHMTTLNIEHRVLSEDPKIIFDLNNVGTNDYNKSEYLFKYLILSNETKIENVSISVVTPRGTMYSNVNSISLEANIPSFINITVPINYTDGTRIEEFNISASTTESEIYINVTPNIHYIYEKRVWVGAERGVFDLMDHKDVLISCGMGMVWSGSKMVIAHEIIVVDGVQYVIKNGKAIAYTAGTLVNFYGLYGSMSDVNLAGVAETTGSEIITAYGLVNEWGKDLGKGKAWAGLAWSAGWCIGKWVEVGHEAGIHNDIRDIGIYSKYWLWNWYCTNRPTVRSYFILPSAIPQSMSPTPNIEDGYIVMRFTLPWSEGSYYPHDVDVYLNGVEIGNLINTIPEGHYIVRFDPSILNYADSGTSINSVTLKTRHLNGGHFVVAADMQIILPMKRAEMYVVTSNQSEANRIINEMSSVMRNKADFGIYPEDIKFSNPVLTAGENIAINTTIFNFGTNGALFVPLQFFDNGAQIGENITIGYIPPLDSIPVNITWNPSHGTHTITVKINPDKTISELDYANNEASKNIFVQGASDTEKPVIISATANPTMIVADGIDASLLNVTATDDVGVTGVKVNLSAIGGSPTQPMSYTDGVWQYETTAAPGTPSATCYLRVTASDAAGNCNDSVSIELNVTKDVIAPIIANITATGITSASANITWDTNEPSSSLVKYGTESGNCTSQKYDSENVTSHSITLTGLLSNTTHYFVVNSTDQSGNFNQSAEYNFTTAPASTPTIEFTYVPPYGSLDDLEGQVWNVTPADYKVAVYIYVSGWWTKPTFAEPLTTIQDDGSWTCDITTGGTDQYATRIKAYLVPDGYIPPQMEGNQTLPEELDQNSVANVEVIRKPERHITFSGYNWTVKSSEMLVGPGPNYFSDSNQSVWIDEDGELHLKILKKDGKWYCAEVYTTESLGYGKYIFYVASRVDQLDKNVVAGLFTWDDDAPEYNYREIDIEFSRWGQAINDNAQYVVQPWDRYGNMHRFNMELNGNYSTHIFDWSTDSIFFRSLHGHYLSPPNDSYIIESWNYTGGDIPPAGKENVRINLWLVYGDPPSDEQEAELIIKRFEHIATIDTTPPSSITNLQSTAGTTYLNFTWTDPPDPDFSHVMVYMDGILQTNITKGVQHFNATGLDPDTSYEIGTHTVDIAGNINETWINHTVMIVTSVFDTGSGTYPSIYGRHTGTIKTLHDVNVSTMYTYPCAGTGGHSEYVRIYGNGVDAAGTWNGYLCDYHNITFPAQFTLLAGHTYNYTIETGSYPQMHHTRTLTAPDGEVTCAEFVDANGKRYDNRIPAFRLESS